MVRFLSEQRASNSEIVTIFLCCPFSLTDAWWRTACVAVGLRVRNIVLYRHWYEKSLRREKSAACLYEYPENYFAQNIETMTPTSIRFHSAAKAVGWSPVAWERSFRCPQCSRVVLCQPATWHKRLFSTVLETICCFHNETKVASKVNSKTKTKAGHQMLILLENCFVGIKASNVLVVLFGNSVFPRLRET